MGCPTKSKFSQIVVALGINCLMTTKYPENPAQLKPSQIKGKKLAFFGLTSTRLFTPQIRSQSNQSDKDSGRI